MCRQVEDEPDAAAPKQLELDAACLRGIVVGVIGALLPFFISFVADWPPQIDVSFWYHAPIMLAFLGVVAVFGAALGAVLGILCTLASRREHR